MEEDEGYVVISVEDLSVMAEMAQSKLTPGLDKEACKYDDMQT